MEAMHGNQMPSPEEINSSAKEDTFAVFENNLREENLRLLKKLRLQEMSGKIKTKNPNQWPFK